MLRTAVNTSKKEMTIDLLADYDKHGNYNDCTLYQIAAVIAVANQDTDTNELLTLVSDLVNDGLIDYVLEHNLSKRQSLEQR